jgi:hypothetical protein
MRDLANVQEYLTGCDGRRRAMPFRSAFFAFPNQPDELKLTIVALWTSRTNAMTASAELAAARDFWGSDS